MPVNGDLIYNWPQESTYVKCPPFFTQVVARPYADETLIKAARPLAILGTVLQRITSLLQGI